MGGESIIHYKEYEIVRISPGTLAVIGGIGGGIVGALIGDVISESGRKYQIEGRIPLEIYEALEKLRKKAHIPDYN